jgi:hypothetical protein
MCSPRGVQLEAGRRPAFDLRPRARRAEHGQGSDPEPARVAHQGRDEDAQEQRDDRDVLRRHGHRGKQIGGLQLLVADTPTSGTVGGISRSNTFWRNQTYDATTDGSAAATVANIQTYMNEVFLRCTRGDDKPDMILASKHVLQALLGLDAGDPARHERAATPRRRGLHEPRLREQRARGTTRTRPASRPTTCTS